MRLWNPKLGKPRFEYRARLNPEHPLNCGLVGWWLFNEGAGDALFDKSRYRCDGTLNGATRVIGASRGPALSFVGASSQYATVNDHPRLNFDGGFSIVAWVNMTDASDFKIVSKGIYGSNTAEYQFKTGSEGVATDNLIIRLYDTAVPNYCGRIYNTVLTSFEGQWIHVAATYNGNGAGTGLKLYLNGLRVDDGDTGTYSPIVMRHNGAAVWFGRQNTWYATGQIGEILIYGRELAAQEMMGLYANPYGTLQHPRLMVEPRRKWFIPARIAGGIFGSKRSAIWNPRLGKPRYEFRARLNPEHPLNRTLRAWWLFNEGIGSPTYDTSGNRYHGTGTATTVVSGPNGPALNFNGTTSFVDCGAAAATSKLDFTSENFSIVARVWWNGVDANEHYIFSRGYYNNSGYTLFVSTGGTLILETNQASAHQYGYGPAVLDSGKWVHIVAVRIGSSTKFYVNGVDVSASSDSMVNPLTSSVTTRIGKYEYGNFFKGKISEVAIYAGALTAAEAIELYSNPYGTHRNPRLLVEPRRMRFSPGAGGAAKVPWYLFFRRAE